MSDAVDDPRYAGPAPLGWDAHPAPMSPRRRVAVVAAVAVFAVVASLVARDLEPRTVLDGWTAKAWDTAVGLEVTVFDEHGVAIAEMEGAAGDSYAALHRDEVILLVITDGESRPSLRHEQGRSSGVVARSDVTVDGPLLLTMWRLRDSGDAPPRVVRLLSGTGDVIAAWTIGSDVVEGPFPSGRVPPPW